MNHRDILVYIAGPFRGVDSWTVAQNVRRAEELALSAWRAGFAAICPHANTANFDGTLPHEAWLEGDLVILKRCDAVLVTPDWKLSVGARAEVDVAKAFNIPIFSSVGHLTTYWALEGIKN